MKKTNDLGWLRYQTVRETYLNQPFFWDGSPQEARTKGPSRILPSYMICSADLSRELYRIWTVVFNHKETGIHKEVWNDETVVYLLVYPIACLIQHVHAQYYSVNYDVVPWRPWPQHSARRVAESYYREQVDDIPETPYGGRSGGSRDIFFQIFGTQGSVDLGIWCSSTEKLLLSSNLPLEFGRKIMPKIWVVAKLMLRHHKQQSTGQLPDESVRRYEEPVCMQFESVVTNSTLSFSDIAFSKLTATLPPLLNLAELAVPIGNGCWTIFTKVPGNFTIENLKGDIDNL